MNRMKALSLYRVVRRLHKLKLPHEMRMLGDQVRVAGGAVTDGAVQLTTQYST